MEKDSPHTVVFRLHRTEPDGSSTVEEREVSCGEEQMTQLLCSPWETVPEEVQEVERSERDLAGAVEEVMTNLRFVVEEALSAEGKRTWTLGWRRPEKDAIRTNGSQRDAIEQRSEPVKMGGKARVAVADDKGSTVQFQRGDSAIHVANQGVSVINCGNTYGVINIELCVEIHPEAGDTPRQVKKD